MKSEYIVAFITGGAVLLAAIVGGIIKLFGKKGDPSNINSGNTIVGDNSIVAGRDVVTNNQYITNLPEKTIPEPPKTTAIDNASELAANIRFKNNRKEFIKNGNCKNEIFTLYDNLKALIAEAERHNGIIKFVITYPDPMGFHIDTSDQRLSIDICWDGLVTASGETNLSVLISRRLSISERVQQGSKYEDICTFNCKSEVHLSCNVLWHIDNSISTKHSTTELAHELIKTYFDYLDKFNIGVRN